MQHVYNAILTIPIYFCPVVVVLLVLAWNRRSFNPLIGGLLILAAFSFDYFVLILPKAASVSSFQWNWEGKILSFLWPWIIIYGFHWLTPEQVGLYLPKSKKNWFEGFLIGLVIAGLWVALCFWYNDFPSQISRETFLYQATMPGLSEELVYRGVILAILTSSLGNQWKIWGIEFGWGLILVSVLFVMVHFVVYAPNQQKIVIEDPIILPLMMITALSLGYVKIKSNSIWPAVLCHNVINSFPLFVFYILNGS